MATCNCFMGLGVLVTLGHRLALAEAICQQPAMMFIASPRRLVVRTRTEDEIGGKCTRTLMQQLVESMLAVCSSATPENWHGVGRHTSPFARDALAVALHLELLEIFGQ